MRNRPAALTRFAPKRPGPPGGQSDVAAAKHVWINKSVAEVNDEQRNGKAECNLPAETTSQVGIFCQGLTAPAI